MKVKDFIKEKQELLFELLTFCDVRISTDDEHGSIFSRMILTLTENETLDYDYIDCITKAGLYISDVSLSSGFLIIHLSLKE